MYFFIEVIVHFQNVMFSLYVQMCDIQTTRWA